VSYWMLSMFTRGHGTPIDMVLLPRPMRRIFIGGKWEAQERLREERDRLQFRRLGQVFSSWLDESFARYWDGTRFHRLEAAHRNDADIGFVAEARTPSGLFLLDTKEPPGETGAREVELGVALAQGLEAWCVGPRRNLYHERLPQFDTWDEVMDALAKEQREGR
jgi:hypothetical protein